MFLAVTSIPTGADALDRALAATGMVRADLQRRLVGILPRVVMVDADAAAIERAQAGLERAGFRTVAFDPLLAPGDGERVVARTLELEDGALVAVTQGGSDARHRVPIGAIALLQRAIRDTTTRHSVTTHERKLALGTAILTGGLKMTKTVERTVTSTSSARELLLVIQRADGGPDVVLYERRLDYRFLGAGLQPGSQANFEAVIALVRSLAPRAAYDDRATKAGFVAGIPVCATDPIDLALFLVELAHRSALQRPA